MTPKEKANELVNKFLLEVRGADRYSYNLESMNLFIAKQCAIIAVDEIIKVAPIGKYEELQSELTPEEVGLYLFEEYWNEVKTEIENL